LGRKRGKASAKKLTSEQRREKARKAARAKWEKAEAHPAAVWLMPPARFHDQRAGKLTKREHEIAECAAQGRSNAYIAQHLRIGVNTVKKHIGHAFEKLGVTNRTELAVLLMNDRNDVMKRALLLDAYMMGSVMLGGGERSV
jgi:DNA-binding NarL/FixJ family response regulator